MPRSQDPLVQLNDSLRTERNDWRRIAERRAEEIFRLRERVQQLEAELLHRPPADVGVPR